MASELTFFVYLQFVPVASFASSILSSKDHPSLVIGALQLVDLLLTKVPTEYRPTFRREGVFHEIESLAIRSVTSPKSKDKEKDKDVSDVPSPADSGILTAPTSASSSAAMIPGFKKLTSLSLEPDDAITLRARIIRFKYLAGNDQAEGDNVFDTLRRLVERISVKDVSEQTCSDALRELADLFASAHTSVSSFELLQSGVVDGLLQFTTDQDRSGKTILRLALLSTHGYHCSHYQTASRIVPGCIHVSQGQRRCHFTDPFCHFCEETSRELDTYGIFRCGDCGPRCRRSVFIYIIGPLLCSVSSQIPNVARLLCSLVNYVFA